MHHRLVLPCTGNTKQGKARSRFLKCVAHEGLAAF